MEQHLPSMEVPSLEERQQIPVEARLRRQMQRDALQPLPSALDDGSELSKTTVVDHYEPDILQEAAQFLRLNVRDRFHLGLPTFGVPYLPRVHISQAQDRLTTMLAYLRDRYAYCFWCGTQYSDHDEMADQCPGEDEEAHD
jgi:hypothetical protein